jgi:hypothetical protein
LVFYGAALGLERWTTRHQACWLMIRTTWRKDEMGKKREGFSVSAECALAGAGRMWRRRRRTGDQRSASGALRRTVKVKLQLQWVAQAQFAGYYAARDQGYYKEAGPGRGDRRGSGRTSCRRDVAVGR